MQRLSGSGTAFAEIDGELIEYDLAPGQKMVVDTGNVAGFEPTVGIEIEQVPGLKNKLLGRRGTVQHHADRPGPHLAADHADLRRGGRDPPVHPDGQRLTQPPARASGCGRKDVWKSEGGAGCMPAPLRLSKKSSRRRRAFKQKAAVEPLLS